jgi:hypothetical protein
LAGKIILAANMFHLKKSGREQTAYHMLIDDAQRFLSPPQLPPTTMTVVAAASW